MSGTCVVADKFFGVDGPKADYDGPGKRESKIIDYSDFSGQRALIACSGSSS